MNAKKFAVDSLITAAVTFVVAVAVTYAYSLVVHGSGSVQWETSFQLAVIFGIVIPLTRERNRTRDRLE